MGINIAICELEAENALCRKMKTDICKVLVEPVDGFEKLSQYDMVVPLDRAKVVLDDWEAFLKRNRLSPDIGSIYLDKVKNKNDRSLLEPLAEKKYNGWVELSGLGDEEREKVLKVSRPENRMTAWHMISFDEMNRICADCPLSWDKNRGCIGTFGPDSSLLPEIASRYDCKIVASVFEAANGRRRYGPETAAELIDEVNRLREVLPQEGKMMVRRYSGVLDRLEAVALVCGREGCSYYFF
ncbi:MAG: hypothetical protein PWQ88_49 [Candidatus Methanomethylophilaceae archaeon]|nr:hypothetical protein [Candidatus Methanomethylophilaceae archaeon]MDI3541810.1 hypothetical protein [Candidatus Methanomethylophilaceae archaeon]